MARPLRIDIDNGLYHAAGSGGLWCATTELRAYIRGVSAAAMSKAVSPVQTRRAEDRVWDLHLAELSERLQTSGCCPISSVSRPDPMTHSCHTANK